MTLKIKLHRLFFLTILIGCTLVACASHNFLKVHYRLPSQSEALQGRAVSLSMKDLRPNKIFMTGNAKKQLKDFSEIFSLVVSQENSPGNLLGAFDVSALFKEIVKQNL